MAAINIRQLAGGPAAGVIRGTITMPRTGPWQAVLWADRGQDLTGRVEIATVRGLTLTGTVNRSAVSGGIVRVRVVAGADGWATPAKGRHYNAPTLHLVLGDLARDSGEALAPTADSALLARRLVAWTTLAGMTTGTMLAALLETVAADVSWRNLPDGALWVGPETWPAVPAPAVREHAELEVNPEEGWALYGVDVPRLVPGVVLGGRRADLVEHLIDSERIRTKVWAAA